MVNVDVSPSVVLGVGLIGAGVSLWQIRRVKPWISKDYDVVVSCISLLVGGILIFQGWRLDPLLLFGQLMTTGAAVSFAIEALRLRSEMYESEEKAALQDVFKRKGPGGGGAGGFQLPPPEASQAAPWAADASAGEQAWAAAQQWQQQPAAAPAAAPGEYYDYQQQGPAAGSAYGYDQQQQGAWDASAAAGGLYQAAEYEAPGADPAAAAGADYGYGYPSSSSGQPSELAFPASYSEPGAPAADGSSPGGSAGGWGGAYGGPQQPGGGGAPGGSKAYDNMDDW
ncbi:putative chloroplast RF66 [Chlorella sorokiniana]|uniref:Chloroplast RF66 n=1 Tax=Chlorella sorokiniana TaxID=3076 RepID=A0A2P6TXI7_CHLSO|nr:putative chloroplast RF66 [Chlorella sorokiniana]|eukprot:PRW58772.1 putative chloroplast RF66 [Chlorella sorokiniana]